MSLEDEILADLHEILREHGLSARWLGIDMLVLASRIDRSQQIDLGGFVDAPDLSVRVPKSSFQNSLPVTGDRFVVDGAAYRIARVSNHARSPLLTLNLTTVDE